METNEESVTHSQPVKSPRKRGRPSKKKPMSQDESAPSDLQKVFTDLENKLTASLTTLVSQALAPLRSLIANQTDELRANCVSSRTTSGNAWTSCTQKLTSCTSLQLCHMHALLALHNKWQNPKARSIISNKLLHKPQSTIETENST